MSHGLPPLPGAAAPDLTTVADADADADADAGRWSPGVSSMAPRRRAKAYSTGCLGTGALGARQSSSPRIASRPGSRQLAGRHGLAA